MLDNYKSIPLLAIVSILLLTPIGLGAFAYSYLQSKDSDSSEQLVPKQNSDENSELEFVPVPDYESETGGANPNSTEGIPLGTYSNPPTNIETGSGVSGLDSPTRHNFDSSIDSNRARQQTTLDSTPDYSAPSSSNSYNESEDNSLVAPLEDDSFLSVPEDEAESAPLSPVAEPLFSE